MYADAKQVRLQKARWIGWLVWSSYWATAILAELSPLTPEARTFYRLLYALGNFVYLPIVLLLYARGYKDHPLVRCLLVVLAYLPLLVETVTHVPLQGGLLWWTVFVAGYGAILLLDPLKEKNYAYGLIALTALLAGLAAIGQPSLAYLPPDAVSHGPLRYGLLIGAMTVAAFVGLVAYADVLRLFLHKEETERQLREKAEEQKAILETTVAELTSLREIDRRRQEEEAFVLVYEGLMQRSYTEAIPAFLRRLLEQLSKDEPVLGGVIYLKEEGSWVVRAQYALPHAEGKKASTGVLALATHERRPYLIYPAPKGCSPIPGALHAFFPVAILYLPFWSEASRETLAIAELFLHALPGSSELERIERLLTRVGTYLWARQETHALL